MKAKQTIKIACNQIEYHDIDELIEFQGNLKELYTNNAEKLWNQIQKNGFADPIIIWDHDGKLNIISGHQRKRVLQVKRAEGWTIPKIPCIAVECESIKQAKELVLAFVSQYGHVTDEGLYEFIIENELDPGMLKLDFDIPNLNMDEFMAGYFEDGGPGEGDKENPGGQGPAIIKDTDFESLKPTDEEHKILKNRKFLVEFSGGKDSSLATLWLRHFYPENEIELMFIDGGADFLGFDLHLHNFARYLGIDLKYLRTVENITDAFIRKGKWPAPIGPYCQQNIIFSRFDDYIAGFDIEKIVVIMGGSSQQKHANKKKKKDRFLTIPRSKVKNYLYFQPIYFLDKDIVLVMLKNIGCPLWEGYSYGLQRTACRVCPGQKPSAYAAIKTNYPDIWSELLALQEILGPGCWQDPNDKMRGDFRDLAEKGMEKFLEGNYKRK